jgi:predicted O-methyltransferase YrrM
MIKTPPEMRATTHELSVAVWTYATIGVLFESGLAAHLLEPTGIVDLATRCTSLSAARIERCLALASAIGVVVTEGSGYRLADGAMAFAQPPMRTSLQGEIRGTLLQVHAFLDSATAPAPEAREAGWRHTDPAILQAQGDSSATLALLVKMSMLPQMGDLASRLEGPDTRFLDVGVGVGSLAIAMCRMFPQLRVVGVDSYELPLSMARQNVARAGLEGRIELVQSAIETLATDEKFDLAWLPTFFIADGALPAATARVHAALRPGGWILYPTGNNANAPAQHSAVFGLVTHLWGGPDLSIERAESLLKEAGFTSVRAVQGPAWAPAMLIGQRALP